MKLYAVCFLLFALAVTCQAQGFSDPLYTGQPGCLTEGELTVGVYPHFRLKSAFWRCSVLGQAATLEVCPPAQGFLEPARACVPWTLWYWTPTVAPPSVPEDETATPLV
uniref:Chitin-binding type-2 domain-containing protein n=1 Tax=Stomoxys calcitrans TaxID=35570 RepID=A0A1I8PFD4_STOCA